ncbi:hypothetical protein MML48_4g00014630 [Holotrichia oblita]|uniref:Uncharacterized protein n=1 Tax=Holotrichia oblita TaxID=644536 RepID=A0ACB9TB56_HOLOL|nr:hypothetical protein MML48_4g00014630 [Holotrichia oblita]
MTSNYRPFTCYFCNKLIERETERNHVTTCGSVLEPCPNKCGSYIPRNVKAKHMQECVNRNSNTLPRLTKQKRVEYSISPSSPTSSTGSPIYNGVPLPPNLKPYNDNNSSSVITNKFLALEQAFAQLQKTTDTIRNRQEQLQARILAYDAQKVHNEKLLYQSQVLLEWKKAVDMQLSNLNFESSQSVKIRNDNERKWSAIIDDKVNLIQDLNSNLNTHKDNFLKEQLYNRETQNELQSEIKKFEKFYKQENAAVCALWNDQGNRSKV